ncbi:hypothetical protein JANAI62_10210 [Jannaschia pagri]|uniref:DUF4177 domain-containing protein n=1 Tax=Jannaschia pagri TaxID=2829797 RepID=A0ABQ4NJ07_9RHOB|nr:MULTISPECIES: DUF4177 domain-containing protein [unclassified Jannaschia]GIT90566.1 hypothetical protein JANAI61_10240 [Jannaschia sp. AI_61]GIT94398.1 hypothetical protein JANAI62_10210 [Jannaschia sp. AI_62]
MNEDCPHQTFEYRVVPAPRKGEKAKGVRSPEARFALAMSRLFNRMGEQGWEFVRADTLPAEERVGLTGSQVMYHALLVFRRSVAPASALPAPAAPPAVEERKPALLLTAPVDEWQGFEEQEVQEAEVIDLLAARARPLAAE